MTRGGVSAADRLQRELEHHRRISARAELIWNWHSPAGQRRAERRAQLLVEAAGLGPGTKALELGCGTGLFLEKVLRSGARVTGIDLSEDLLAQARERLAGQDFALDQGNAEQLPYPDGAFDAVYGSSILHHLDVEAALREVVRVLRPGGHLAFAEPNLLNPQIAFTYKVGPREWFGLSEDEMAFTRFRIRRLLEQLDLREITIRPHDFLHPAIPRALVDAVFRLGEGLERVPLIREIAGSLLIRAVKG